MCRICIKHRQNIRFRFEIHYFYVREIYFRLFLNTSPNLYIMVPTCFTKMYYFIFSHACLLIFVYIYLSISNASMRSGFFFFCHFCPYVGTVYTSHSYTIYNIILRSRLICSSWRVNSEDNMMICSFH